ncbi:MAG TPA: class I SAM-dependent methyltransferase [Candidatus Limnocylindrales bacterium]
MPFRTSFDCLWCGRSWSVRDPDDLEGWAQLCPDCIGRGDDNDFVRYRVRAALAERGRDTQSATPGGKGAGHDDPDLSRHDEMVTYYEARASEYDDWYLRRGRYERGPLHDVAWAAELDEAGRWLDGLPISGEIVELAAGTGWWSPLLAAKGELSLYDAAPAPLDRARERLVAHRLRAHLHVRDAWAEPDRQVDAVFCGFWLSHVPRSRLARFLGIVRRWLKPGGVFAFIDSRFDPQSNAIDHQPVRDQETMTRRLDDGREFTIPKVYYEPHELEEALAAAGFESSRVATTARFFMLGQAGAPESEKRPVKGSRPKSLG